MIINDLFEAPQLCPECGGISFSNLILAEKKDACYYKVKASAKVWPSAYASGRLVQCRKKGAGNYGNKSEGVAEDNLNELAPGAGGGDAGNYFQALASAWYNGTFDTGSLQKGIKSQQDVERLLQRGIVGPDGVTRKYAIDYNSDFDGVVISSDDYYEHSDYNDQGQEVDSRTDQKWGPHDYMEFSDEELGEDMSEGKKKKKSSRSMRGYFFPGYAGYGGGESGEGGGDGGGGESKNHGMTEESNLHSGSYVRDREDSSGEVFVMRGSLEDRRVRIEDRNGSGWNISPSRLVAVDDTDPAIARYFGQGVAEGDLNEKSTSQAQFRTMAAAAHDPEFARKVGIKQSVAKEFNRADKGQDYKSLPNKADESKSAPKEKEADYGDDYQAMVGRLKQLAGAGPLRTVYDPTKRVYKNVPIAVQPKR